MSKENTETIKIAEKIIDGIIDETIPSYNSALRLYYRLVSIIKNENEMAWAKRELSGYTDIKTIPEYRKFYFQGMKECVFVHQSCRDLTYYIDNNKKFNYHPYVKVINNIFKRKSQNSTFNNYIPLNQNHFTDVLISVSDRLFEQTNRILNDLKFGDIVEDIFYSKRNYVDEKLLDISPQAIQKFISAYQNLQSENKEDWANAVHSCRRILKTVADNLYPPSEKPIIKNNKEIKVGNDKYINRLVLYIENKSSSDKFTSVVGSHLKYIGERLDSIYDASNKGSHDEVTLDEARRYIIYTYLLLGDILSL